MKTIYSTATSLNGFLADENDSLEWLFQYGEPGGKAQQFFRTVGVIAMGSTTYEWLLKNHVYSEKGHNPWPYSIPAFVFTTRKLQIVPDADIRFVKGDVRPVHEKMKELTGDKNIWIMGGGELAAKFYDQKLLEEMIIHLAGITLSGGAPLFPRVMKKPMKLLELGEMQPGLIEIRYKVEY